LIENEYSDDVDDVSSDDVAYDDDNNENDGVDDVQQNKWNPSF